ncbi:unnamed protein product [Linum trigynum]|uniref:Serine-rich protein-like protein n=1 Tax=Linum trigynum TaxID=586398 RepID=A0AAV2CSJ3_9ROSI
MATVSSSPSSANSSKTRSTTTCICSSTNHPGLFRCSRHRNQPNRTAASASTMAATASSSPVNSSRTRSSTACLCSPTKNPWSFRCSLHKNQLSNRKESTVASYSSSSSPVNSLRTRSTITCLFSPTNNPRSLLCSLHKNQYSNPSREVLAPSPWKEKAFTTRAFLRRMIKPPRRDETRRLNFRPTPSRFFTMHASSSGSVAVS